ncbi:MAG TPA: molybdopterin cofactor-binding domain-containing protein, partial [Polyangiaceae bacterium]|nr:molybdopterin cofactor-binding domain-containing protein [Polyangiaceae bacterium]
RLGYGELATAAAALPPLAEAPPLKDSKAFRLIGRGVRRVDGPAIVTGSARYGLDVRLPGMRFAAVARCPVLGGSAGRVDEAPARALPGVLAVARVSTGVAVIAESTWAALRGRDALAVAWDEGPRRDFDSAHYRARLEAAARAGGGRVTRREGEGADALARAPRSLEALYAYPFQTHAPIEPANSVAHVQEGRCEIWSPTQNPERIRTEAAALLGVPPEAVRVNVTLLGGGFGRRLGVDYALEAVEASRAARAPVMLVFSREDDTRHGFFQPASAHHLRAAIGERGAPIAWTHAKAGYLQNLFGRPTPDDLKGPDFWRVASHGAYDIPYEIADLETSYVEVEAPVPNGPYRSVFAPSCVFARECFLDELAHAAGRDPLELRLALLGGGRVERPGPLAIDRPRLARVLRLAAEKAGWGGPLPPGRGRGIAATIYHEDTFVAQVVEAEVSGGRVRARRVVCAVDAGTIVNPRDAEAQVEGGIIFGLSTALGGEITFRGGRCEQSGYGDYPIVRIDE